MPLTFLLPAFLVGLAALAIPVWVHLSRRQSERVQEFPSLMFVRRLPAQTEKRRRLRDVLLLVLRCAAIVLLVAAFARPFLDGPMPTPTARAGAREVVVLLDRSASMGYGDRWERAVAAARTAFEELGPGDRASLVAFDDGAEVLLRASREGAVLRAALDAQRPASSRTRFAAGLKVAEGLLAASPLPRHELVLISDFQRSGWAGGEAAVGLSLPAGTRVVPVPVGDTAMENLAVTAVSFDRESRSGRERVRAVARLVNQGDRDRPALPVSLEIEGRTLETRAVDLPARGSATVEFTPFTLAAANTRGAVRAGDDPLPADNEHRFVLSPGAALGVVIAEGPGAGPESSLYLRRALSLGDDPGFRVAVRRIGALAAADLEGNAVVVVNDAPLPEGAAGDRLRDFVRRGGGLLLVAGPATGSTGWRGAGWLAALGTRGASRTSESGVALGFVDLSHPVFEPFATPRSGSFSSARFFGFRPLDVPDSAHVLARFSDGSAALAELRTGRGRVLAWGSSLDQGWNDLALQPVFLPFVHRLVRHAAGYAPEGAARTVGEVVAAQRPGAVEAVTWARTPSGERVRLDAASPLRLAEQGFYELRSGTTGETLDRVVATNLDPAESDLGTVDPAEVVAAIVPPADAGARSGVVDAPTPRERERQQAIWWYLMLAAFVLLTADVWMANRRAPVAR